LQHLPVTPWSHVDLPTWSQHGIITTALADPNEAFQGQDAKQAQRTRIESRAKTAKLFLINRYEKLFFSLSSTVLSTLSFVQPAMWGEPVAPRPESEVLAQSVPIADVHMHFNVKGRQTVEQMLQHMQEGNIRWGGGVGDYTGDMQAALGDRYLPAIGQAEFTKVLLSSGEKGLQNLEHPVFVDFFKEADVLIASGKARGFGEIHIGNKTTSNVNDPFGRSIPLESPVVQRMYEIANEHPGFVQIRYDKSARTVEQIITMAQRYPKSLTIVAHCMPKGTPDDMRKIFAAAPNVVCEISVALLIFTAY
jgi:hypothetical protein